MSRLTPQSLQVFGIFALVCVPLWAEADGADTRRAVTLVVAFDDGAPQPAVSNALQSELAEIWKSSEVRLDWRPIDSLQPGESFADLIVVHFKGECRAHPVAPAGPMLLDERGPHAFGYTSVVDGDVLPFSNILCDPVLRSVKSALPPGQRKTVDTAFGKALGRVLSHELYHVLRRTQDHQGHGLAQRSLSGRQLVSPGFTFIQD